MKAGGRYIPDIGQHRSTFWYEIAPVNVIFRGDVRKAWNVWVGFGKTIEGTHKPIGTTVFQRRVSLTIAFMYGKFGRSANAGSLSVPTTVSISTCAFLLTSGYRSIAR